MMMFNLLFKIYNFLHKNIFKRCHLCWWNTYDEEECGSFFNICKKCYPTYWKKNFKKING